MIGWCSSMHPHGWRGRVVTRPNALGSHIVGSTPPEPHHSK